MPEAHKAYRDKEIPLSKFYCKDNKSQRTTDNGLQSKHQLFFIFQHKKTSEPVPRFIFIEFKIPKTNQTIP